MFLRKMRSKRPWKPCYNVDNGLFCWKFLTKNIKIVWIRLPNRKKTTWSYKNSAIIGKPANKFEQYDLNF